MLKKLPLQIAILLLAGIIVGLAANAANPDGIPLHQEYQAIDDSGEKIDMPFSYDPQTDTVFTYISAPTALELFQNDEAVFLDARSEDLYSEGHISGAVNVDFEGSMELFDSQMASFLDQTDTSQLVITYCDGEECDLSLMMARYLFYDLNFKHVYVFHGGWEKWIEHELPVEEGASQ